MALTKEQKIGIGIGGIVTAVIIGGAAYYLLTKPKPVCNDGQTKCVGTTLYKCINGKWTLYQANSTVCGYVGPGEPEKYVCSICGATFATSSLLAAHIASAHPTDLCAGVICSDICVGYDLYSQICNSSTGGCVVNNLKQINSSICGYVLTAKVYGTVTESTTSYNAGANVSNAEIVLTNKDTKTNYTTITDSVGYFELSVPYGYYNCVISKNGFFMYTHISNINISQQNFNFGYHTGGIMVMRMPTAIELRYPSAANFWGSSCCATILGKHQELYVTAIVYDQLGNPMEDANVRFVINHTSSDISNGGFQASDGQIWWVVEGRTNSSGSIRTRYWARSEAGEARGFNAISTGWYLDNTFYSIDYPWKSSYGQITISAGGGAGRFTCYGKCEKTFTLIATGALDKGGI